MLAGWVLPFAEDLFQVGRRAIMRPSTLKNFFKKEHLGLVGLAGGLRHPLKFPVGRWLKNTGDQMSGFTYGGVWPFMMVGAAYYGSKAGFGHMLPTATGFMASAAPAAVGAALAGAPGALAFGALFSEPVAHAIRTRMYGWTMRDRRTQKFEMSDPNYQDSKAAYTMRQAAVQELSGSLLNARSVLGREAALMHA